MAKPTDLEIFMFDLQGFLLLKNALSADEIAELNATVDEIPALQPNEWFGYIQGHRFGDKNGINLQQIYEAGEPFERLIDHPSWIDKVKHFVGGEGTFDWSLGPLFIDENFVSLRGPGEGIFPHSGGFSANKRCQYRYINGRFHCGQINILMALTDIGPGDGATVVVPGSHKSHFPHPDFDGANRMNENADSAKIAGSRVVHMEKGDVLLFVDAIIHGAESRENEGQRRICVFRYGPSWGNFRHGYQPSPELLARLTPDRRKIVQPQQLLVREPQVADRLAKTEN